MTNHNEVQNVLSEADLREIATVSARRRGPHDTTWTFDDLGLSIFVSRILAKHAAAPLTVSLSPDPRGVHVAVHQGSECVHAEAMAVPGADGQGVPDKLDAFRDDDMGRCAFVSGWNSCRAAMLVASPTPPAAQCLTCNDEGAVGNILTANFCPDCTPPAGEGQEPVESRNVQQEREAFERWAPAMGFSITPDDSCGYKDKRTNAAWVAWGAMERMAEKHPAPQAAQPTIRESQTVAQPDRTAFERDQQGSDLSYEWRTDEYTDSYVMERWRIWKRAWQARAALFTPQMEGDALTQAARDVLAERLRQIKAEGWTHQHDDEHSDGSMTVAAAAYALYGVPGANRCYDAELLWKFTRWDSSWFKPRSYRINLIKSAALILAEIERIDRIESAAIAAMGREKPQ